MPERIQRKRARGWKKPPNTVNVTRPSKWSNPFVIGRHGTREEVIERFAKEIAADRTAEIQHDLKGKNLMCWCRSDQACHGDILLRIANQG